MLIIPAILSSFQSLKDKTLKIVIETNEPTPDQIGQIAKMVQSFGFMAFKEDAFRDDQKEMLESLKSDFEETGKSPSQRLRGVFYRNYEQDSQGYDNFQDYYRAKMEKLIEHFKSKLD